MPLSFPIKKKKKINKLVHAQRLHKKLNLILWTECLMFSNALLFLTFQFVQKRHKGAALHTFLLFLPTTNLCQLVSVSLTEEGRTQDMRKSEKRRCQTALVLSQWMRMWSTDSSSLQQRKHLFAIAHPLSGCDPKLTLCFKCLLIKKPILALYKSIMI